MLQRQQKNRMLQNQTDKENLEIDLKTAAIKFIDASYNYDEKAIQHPKNVAQRTCRRVRWVNSSDR